MTARDDTPHRVVPSGIVVCPACGRQQTTGADGRPTPHTTVMGGSQLCGGRGGPAARGVRGDDA